MKKKNIIIIILLTTILAYNFLDTLNVKTMNELFSSSVFENIDGLEVTVYFSWQSKTFEVRNTSSVNEIIKILSNMKIKHVRKRDGSFQFKVKNSYNIKFLYIEPDMPYYVVRIFDKQNMFINGDHYKIKNSSDLEKIYEITIMSQDALTLDEYYYDIIED